MTKTNRAHGLPVLPLAIMSFFKNYELGLHLHPAAVIGTIGHVASHMFIPEVGIIDDIIMKFRSAATLTNLDGRQMRDAVALLEKQKKMGIDLAKREFQPGHLVIASTMLAIHPKSDSAIDELHALLFIAAAAEMPPHGLTLILFNGKYLAHEIDIPISDTFVRPLLIELETRAKQMKLEAEHAANNGHDQGESGDDAVLRRQATDPLKRDVGESAGFHRKGTNGSGAVAHHTAESLGLEVPAS